MISIFTKYDWNIFEVGIHKFHSSKNTTAQCKIFAFISLTDVINQSLSLKLAK